MTTSEGPDVQAIQHALEAARDGRTHEALALLERAVGPEADSRLWALLGDLYASEERYAEAVTAFGRAIEKTPSLAGAFSGLGRAYRELGQLGLAEEALQTSVSLEPTPARLVMLGDVQSGLGREDLARHSFEQATLLDPQNEEAFFNLALLLRSKDPRESARLLDVAVAIAPHAAKVHREIGFALLRDGRLAEAESSLLRALDLEPRDPWSHVYSAALAEARGQVDAAMDHLRLAREYAATEGYPRYFLGQLYARIGKWVQAEEEFGRAIEVEPHDPESLFHFARFLNDSGRPQEARALLERALSIDSQHEPSAALLRDSSTF